MCCVTEATAADLKNLFEFFVKSLLHRKLRNFAGQYFDF